MVGIDSAGHYGISYTDSVTVVESGMSLELLLLCLESKTKQIHTVSKC